MGNNNDPVDSIAKTIGYCFLGVALVVLMALVTWLGSVVVVHGVFYPAMRINSVIKPAIEPLMPEVVAVGVATLASMLLAVTMFFAIIGIPAWVISWLFSIVSSHNKKSDSEDV